MKTVLCYGDSNTFGYDPNNGLRYPKEIRWTTILGKLLGDEYEVIPEGLNGRTTAYDREDVAWKNGFSTLLPCIGSHFPIDYLVFMLGTNDCNSNLMLQPSDIAAGMEKLVTESMKFLNDTQGYSPHIVLVVPAAIGPDYRTSVFSYQLDADSVSKSHAIAPLYKKIADKYGCSFLDGSEILEVSEIDSEHLTEKSHAKLAGLLSEIIKSN